jgi:hypothetical protein
LMNLEKAVNNSNESGRRNKVSWRFFTKFLLSSAVWTRPALPIRNSGCWAGRYLNPTASGDITSVSLFFLFWVVKSFLISYAYI